jgi:hypothetical protein
MVTYGPDQPRSKVQDFLSFSIGYLLTGRESDSFKSWFFALIMLRSRVRVPPLPPSPSPPYRNSSAVEGWMTAFLAVTLRAPLPRRPRSLQANGRVPPLPPSPFSACSDLTEVEGWMTAFLAVTLRAPLPRRPRSLQANGRVPPLPPSFNDLATSRVRSTRIAGLLRDLRRHILSTAPLSGRSSGIKDCVVMPRSRCSSRIEAAI